MIYYTVVDTPLGRMGIATTNLGICRLDLKIEGKAPYRDSLARRFKTIPRRNDPRLEGLKKGLILYLEGGRPELTPPLDLQAIPDFQRRVLEEVRRIPYGTVRTYKEVASSIGRPKAARAVGQALNHNPIPILIPCHRVVRSDGRLGGFSEGVELKRWLLSREGVILRGPHSKEE